MVAVVLGGGVGQRIGAQVPKQLLKLGGRTLIEHCVAAFEQAPGVDEILVVMAAGYVDQVKEILAEAGYRKVSAVIQGGVGRPDSTRIALAAIAGAPRSAAARRPADDCGVLLHDAARPLVDQRIIADCVASLQVHEAIGVAVPTSDTIVVTDNGVMHSMPRRGDAAALPDPAVLPAVGDHPGARARRRRPGLLPHRRLRRGAPLPAQTSRSTSSPAASATSRSPTRRTSPSPS